MTSGPDGPEVDSVFALPGPTAGRYGGGEPVAPKREESCNYRFSINNLVTSSISEREEMIEDVRRQKSDEEELWNRGR